jgi:PAS domain S-box-containing protein
MGMAGTVEVEAGGAADRPAVFALDDDRRFTYLNDEAQSIFRHPREELEGDQLWGWLSDEVRETYQETIETAAETGDPAQGEVRCLGESRWYRIRTYPMEGGVSVHLEDLEAEAERERELERREQALRQAHEITADREASPREQIERLLGVIRRTLGTDVGLVSRYDETEEAFEVLSADTVSNIELHEGQLLPPEETRACLEVVDTEQTLAIRDLGTRASDLLEASAGVRSYLGAPVHVDGEVYGTFCFFASDRRCEDFDDWETSYVDLFSDAVGAAIERTGGLAAPG